MNFLKRVFLQPGGRLRSGWRLLTLIVVLVPMAAAAEAALHAIGLPDPTPDNTVLPLPMLVAVAVSLTLTLLVVGVLMRLMEGRSLATMGLPLHGPWIKGLGSGLCLGALPVVLTVAVVWIVGDLTISAADLSPATLLAVTPAIVIGLFCISSVEEIVLRGYSLQLLSEGGGRWVAAIITGALFGLAHVENPGANPLGLVNTAVNGVLLAWVVMRSGSLWIACGYHAGWNLCGSMGFGMRLSGLDLPGAALHTELVGPTWLTGGDYGFEGSAIAGVVELAVLMAVVMVVPRLPGHPEARRYFNRLRDREALPRDRATPAPISDATSAADHPGIAAGDAAAFDQPSVVPDSKPDRVPGTAT